MELVKSYLNEVGRFLPQEQREDILSDLRGAIEDEIAGSAEAAGRPATIQDEQEVLQRFGHPLKVAARYQDQKYLIGPELYPAWWQTLKTVGIFALAIQVIVTLIMGVTGDTQIGPLGLLYRAWELLIWVSAIITLIFIAIEYSGKRLRWYDNWRPQALAGGSVSIINRGDIITNLVSEGFFLLWWNDVVVLQNWIPGLAEHFQLSLSSVWEPWFWPLNLIFAICFVLHLLVLIKGVWQKQTLILELLTGIALMGIAAVLLLSGDLVVLSGDIAVATSKYLQPVIKLSVLVVAGFVAWDTWIAVRLLRNK